MTVAVQREPAAGPGARAATACLGAVDWLCLAAAPTFAIMALLTAVFGAPPDILCAATPHGAGFGGMTPMYLLMSAFHLPPWLRLMSSRRRGAPRT